MVTEGNELEGQGVTAEPEAPIAEQVPTNEDQGNLSAGELQKLKEDNQRLSELIGDNPDGYKGLQRKLNQVNEELKKRSAADSRLDTLEQTQRILVSMIAERENINADDIPEGKKTDYLKQFDEIITQQKQKVEQQDFMAKVKDYQERTDALKLDSTSEEYLDIKDFVTSGKFERADARLKKLEARVNEQKKEEKTEPKETEVEMRKRIEKEVREQIFKEKGWNVTDTGSPSGGTSSDAEFLQEFSEGKRNAPDDFKRASKLLVS